MPSLRVESGATPVDIYYEVFTDHSCLQEHGLTGSRHGARKSQTKNPPEDVVLIMGLAAGHGAWTPQLHGLLDPKLKSETQKLRVMTLDNRGVGKSSAPRDPNAYTTSRMASDVVAVLNELAWDNAHIVGHSMGGMIAARLAVDYPERVASLTLVSSTNGGWQALPQKWRSYKLFWKLVRDPKRRAKYDLKFHYTKETLQTHVQGEPRKEALLREYNGEDTQTKEATGALAPDPSEQQQDCGLHGQLRAVWRHSLSSRELARLKDAPFRKQVIHGRSDILAMPKWSERMASRLNCPCTMLRGAHMVTRECGTEINALLRSIIFPPQGLPADHYMAINAELEVVSPLCATADASNRPKLLDRLFRRSLAEQPLGESPLLDSVSATDDHKPEQMPSANGFQRHSAALSPTSVHDWHDLGSNSVYQSRTRGGSNCSDRDLLDLTMTPSSARPAGDLETRSRLRNSRCRGKNGT